MAVRWIPYVYKKVVPVSETEIEQLELYWDVKLPKDYKQLIREHQGMAPEPCAFNVGRGNHVFNCLMILDPDRQRSYSVYRVYDLLKPYIAPRVYPFGTTPGGDHLCFDYREALEEPKVVLLTVETFIYPVANSFHELLEVLYDE